MSFDIQNIKRQVLADKKKLGMLTILVLVGLLMWGRLLMTDVPRTAVAKPNARAESAAKSTPDPGAANTRTVASVTRQLPQIEADLSDRVTRDLFVFNQTGFPAIEKPAQPEKPVNPTVQKLVSDPADKAKEEEKAIRAEAVKLQLQSTILGVRPRAMINGTLLGPGEAIQGFELIEVRSRNVTVKKAEIVIVLEM